MGILRPLTLSDSGLCAEFIGRLDGADIRRRFGTRKLEPKDLLVRRCWGAFDTARSLAGIVSLHPVSERLAEFGLIVRSDRKRRGIGRTLVACLRRWVPRPTLVGYVTAENGPMLALARATGFSLSRWDETLVRITLAGGRA
jgi:GNAT superfamily N-acetyltransferase